MIDVNINDRTPPKPCQTPGCTYDRFHACIFGKPDLFPQILGQRARKNERSVNWFSAVAAAQFDRWERHRADHKLRDEAMVELYRTGVSIREVATKFGVGKATAQAVLKRAANSGEIKMRRRGGNYDLPQSA